MAGTTFTWLPAFPSSSLPQPGFGECNNTTRLKCSASQTPSKTHWSANHPTRSRRWLIKIMVMHSMRMWSNSWGRTASCDWHHTQSPSEPAIPSLRMHQQTCTKRHYSKWPQIKLGFLFNCLVHRRISVNNPVHHWNTRKWWKWSKTIATIQINCMESETKAASHTVGHGWCSHCNFSSLEAEVSY